jgi:hypothetical protein
MKLPVLSRIGIAMAALFAAIAGSIVFVVGDIPDALTARHERPVGVLIDNVRLISLVPGAPEVEDARAVLVMGDRIVEVGAAGSLRPQRGVRVVDGKGRTLIPGLIDAHIHLNDEAELAAYLAHGVTGVRNMSGYPFHLRVSQRIANGTLLGPDFVTTGPILNSPGPNALVLQQTVVSADEARAAVRAQYEDGYRALKIYSNLTREAFDAIIAEADRLDMSVTGHSPEGVRTEGIPLERPFDIPFEQSLGRGLSTLEHVETIVWHGLRDDLEEERMRRLAAAISRSGEVVTPTLIAHRRLVLIAESQGGYLNGPGSDTINPAVRFFERSAEQHWSGVDASGYERPHADFFLIATRLLHEAGVPLIAGTDSGGFGLVPGASLTQELELLVAAGLTPHEALASATRTSAEALGFEKSGVVAPGYRANLVLLTGDPLKQIGAVERPVGVMVGGRWLDEVDLEELRAAARDTSFLRSLWHLLELKLFG